MKKIIAVVLVVMMLVSVLGCSLVTSSAADSVTLDYKFAGEESTKASFAEGTITLSVTNSSMAGKYYIYWADNTKALDGYREICTLNPTINSAATYKLLDHVAIPPKATKMIAIRSDSAPSTKTVANAAAVHNIHSLKVNKNTEPLYTFGAFSDPQIANDDYGNGKYPFDEIHWKKALETFDNRGAEFLVSSGDIVNDQNGNVTYALEYQRYQKLLAESPYANPVWESNGNHDVHVNWNSGAVAVSKPFVMGTGLDSTAATIKANKMYFEITEPKTGDHFIFMAQEGRFHTNKGEQFTDAQLAWLEGLLKKYNGDGKNIFIMEHANVEGWGSGDRASSPYLYDLGMKKSQTSTAKFIKLMETYKNCIIVTGHTHLELSAHLNYSDNNGTSAPMIHNSAIGGVRRLLSENATTTDRTPKEGLSEGYIVEVYPDSVIFYGMNLYSNVIMPDCTYIIPMSTSLIEQPTEKPTENPTVAPTEKPVLYGDVDFDGKVAVTDATEVQRHIAKVITLNEEQLVAAAVAGEKDITVMDATYIQKHVAKIITQFPVETKNAKDVAVTGADDVTSLISTVKAELSSNFIYSSFDQYMKLKRVVKDLEASGDKSQAAYDKLNAAYDDYKKILSDIGVGTGGGNNNTGETIDVYFKNTLNWSTVNAYLWVDGGSAKVSWPGEAMQLVGDSVYKISVPANVYNRIIFNDGTTQTVDLTLSNKNNELFIPSTMSGKQYNCTTGTYTN